MRSRRRLLTALVAVTLAGGALAGCAGGDGSARDPAPVQPGESVSSSDPFPSYSARALTPSTSPTAEPITLTGRPEEGVEPGCVVMRSGDTLYQLIGGNREMHRCGRQGVVRGTIAAGLAARCQQGVPFLVSEFLSA